MDHLPGIKYYDQTRAEEISCSVAPRALRGTAGLRSDFGPNADRLVLDVEWV